MKHRSQRTIPNQKETFKLQAVGKVRRKTFEQKRTFEYRWAEGVEVSVWGGPKWISLCLSARSSHLRFALHLLTARYFRLCKVNAQLQQIHVSCCYYYCSAYCSKVTNTVFLKLIYCFILSWKIFMLISFLKEVHVVTYVGLLLLCVEWVEAGSDVFLVMQLWREQKAQFTIRQQFRAMRNLNA